MSEAMETMAAMRLEDGRRWGEAAAPFQLDDATAVLDRTPDDPRMNWLGRSKGSSKTTDVAAMSSSWLLTQAQSLDEGYVVASDEEQAARLLRTAARLIARTPGLADQLEVQSRSIVHARTNARVIALAADVAGTEGVLSPWLICDELPNWADTHSSRGMWTAIFSSVPKVPSCRLVVIGHAGTPASWQHKLFERAKQSRAWRVNNVTGPAPWIDAVELEEQKASLMPFQWERRWQNRWAAADDLLANLDDLRRCVVLDGPLDPVPGVHYEIAVDIGLVNDRTVVAVCHTEPLNGGVVELRPSNRSPDGRDLTRRRMVEVGMLSPMPLEGTSVFGVRHREAPRAKPVRVVLDRMAVWQGSRKDPVRLAEIEGWVLQAHSLFNRAHVTLDPWEGVGMAQRLRDQGVKVQQFNFTNVSKGKLTSVLFNLIRDTALSLPDDADLIDELAHVRLREKSAGIATMDHDAGRHDDRAVALALAAHVLVERPAEAEWHVSEYRNLALRGTR